MISPQDTELTPELKAIKCLKNLGVFREKTQKGTYYD